MDNIKSISIESGEKCNVDANRLHEILLRLPADIYLTLYYLMQVKMGDKEPVRVGCTAPVNVDYEAIRKAVHESAVGKNPFQIV